MAVVEAPVAAVGDNCIDRYVPTGRDDTVGGNALNVAVGLVNAGHPTTYLGAVGGDAEGELIVRTAEAVGVDMSGVRVLPAHTGVTTVELLPDGERIFRDESYGASALFRLEDGDLARLRGCVWVHAANLPGAPAAVLRLAAEEHRVSYDFSDHGDVALRTALCPHLAIAFFSAPTETPNGAAGLAQAALAEGAEIAVVTRGRAGSLAAVHGSLFEQDAVAVEPVETLGAGDAFIAAFISAQVTGESLTESLRRGAVAAARTCELVGPWPVAKEVRV